MSFVLIYTGTISVNPAQRAYLDSLSTFDLGITVLIGLSQDSRGRIFTFESGKTQ